MINVITKINPDLYIEVDRDKIRQVLMNLTTNSVQEMPDGGELRIEAAESEKHVTITVSDSGGGIPADIREKIFEPFYSKKKSGTGLGLPLCKKIMNAHGGDIVAGDCENGAVFTLIVPKRG
jgi:signal transduction histidine kinase